jgi:tetratricopeptide (TPR) repeat protein
VVVVVVGAVLAAVLWWTLPRLVGALPGRVRQYVPESIIALVTTPLPTALPAPAAPAPEELALALGAATVEAAFGASTTSPQKPTEPGDSSPEAAATSLLPTPTLAPTVVPLPTASPLPPYGRIDGLPIIPQKFNNCGPTNLTLVLNYYGVAVDQFDVAAVIRPTYEDRNVSPEELVAYVREHTGLAASAHVGGDVALLRRLIDAGFPVIIEKGLEPDEATGWMGHYLTVFGYDDITQHLYVRDTYLGPWKGDGLAAYRDVERYWAQFNNVFVVVYPPVREAELGELLGPGYEAPAMWAAAANRARTTVAHEPDNAFAWFNLGTSLTALARQQAGDVPTEKEDTELYAAATAAFDQARLLGLPARMLWYQFAPYEAYLAAGRPAEVLTLAEATFASQGGRSVEETYLYQGHALRVLGDEPAARAAYSRAAELNSTSPVGLAARAALNDN